ncbi:MAG: hypothetical protein Q4E34_06125 [Synergistaceae bacterium]|nr:hypothetical protein [Synergistaceae bacterium]
MACFIVPATEAVVSKFISERAKKQGKISFAHKLGWLTKLLAGGSVLLAFEHFWHGEIVPFAPFFTAGREKTLAEMSTAGVCMAMLCTVVWCAMLSVCAVYEKRQAETVR